eukprot:scaffold17839_cov120-Isochrysis_galbana.AAC.2
MEFTVLCRRVLSSTVQGGACGARAAASDACAYRLVGCWDVARPLGEGQVVVRHRGLDVGERHCLPTVARRVRNPHRKYSPNLISFDTPFPRFKTQNHGVAPTKRATHPDNYYSARAAPNAAPLPAPFRLPPAGWRLGTTRADMYPIPRWVPTCPQR